MKIGDERRDTLLISGNVLTLDAAQPYADAILIRRGRIAWVGERRELSTAVFASADVIDCAGQTVIPGFIDAHCHLLAYAVSLTAVDCSPNAVSSIDDILRKIGRAVGATARGGWIRAVGYSDFDLREKRHPTRWDLDRVAPLHPVRLNHRSGHAVVLNSAALERMNITNATEEPSGGTISRDLASGEPDGLLLEMDEWLDERIPSIGEARLAKAVSQASKEFLARGVTSVADATASNSVERWELLQRLARGGMFAPNLIVMPGEGRLADFEQAGLNFGNGRGSCKLRHAKIMLTRSGGGLYPGHAELKSIIESAHARGFPVAIHAVESEAVRAAAEALAASRAHGLRDRIEHASECPPDTLDALALAKPVVVSQPRFIRDSGDRYLSEFGSRARWLYRYKSLMEHGVALAASSDAPVSAPDPMKAMQAAVTRQTCSGAVLAADERLTATQALEMYTKNAAYAVCDEKASGTIAIGKRADIAILSADPTTVAHDSISEIRTNMTIVGGRVVWEA